MRARAWIEYGSPGASVRDSMLTYPRPIFSSDSGLRDRRRPNRVQINSLRFRGDEFTRSKSSLTPSASLFSLPRPRSMPKCPRMSDVAVPVAVEAARRVSRM